MTKWHGFRATFLFFTTWMTGVNSLILCHNIEYRP